MPIPKSPVGGWNSVEEMNEAYKLCGFSKEPIEFNWISFEPRIGLVCTRYRVDPAKLTCSCDGRDQFVFVRLYSTGIYETCGACRVTSGPLASELFQSLGSRRVSTGEANKILAQTGQAKPLGLIDLTVDPVKNLRK